MNRPPIDWKTLNAYVDGELAPAAMARVAEALADDPGLAQQMAKLRRLKSAVFQSRPPACPPISLEPRRAGRRTLVAAALLLIALFGSLLSGLLPEPGTTPDQLEQVVAAHQAWRDAGTSADLSSSGSLLKSSLEQLQLDAYIPDLSPAGLRYHGIRRIAAASGRGLHVGYRGSHGCQVSLIVFPGAGKLSGELKTFEHAAGRIYGWQVRSNTFYLLAPRMDPRRLRQVAAAVHRMTRAHTPMDRGTTLALNQARTQAPPCAV